MSRWVLKKTSPTTAFQPCFLYSFPACSWRPHPSSSSTKLAGERPRRENRKPTIPPESQELEGVQRRCKMIPEAHRSLCWLPLDCPSLNTFVSHWPTEKPPSHRMLWCLMRKNTNTSLIYSSTDKKPFLCCSLIYLFVLVLLQVAWWHQTLRVNVCGDGLYDLWVWVQVLHLQEGQNVLHLQVVRTVCHRLPFRGQTTGGHPLCVLLLLKGRKKAYMFWSHFRSNLVHMHATTSTLLRFWMCRHLTVIQWKTEHKECTINRYTPTGNAPHQTVEQQKERQTHHIAS